MSIEHIAAVLARYHGKPHLKLTLLVLADSADSETGECWPSYDAIAGKSGVTKRTAIRNVSELVSQRVIDVLDRGGFRTDPATGRQVFVSNVYRVRKDRLDLMPHWREVTKSYPQEASHGVADVTVSMSPTTPCHGVADVTLTVSEEPSKRTVSGQPVDNRRTARLAERREVRAKIRQGLLDQHL